MKILFIFTGGTIGSENKGQYISANNKTPDLIIEKYKSEYGIDFEYDVIVPFYILSENLCGVHIKDIYEIIKKNIENYDGVIVFHGTDTIQYQAAALSYLFGNNCKPILLVSAAYPITNPCSNGICNMHGAVLFIKQKIGKGVFVSYKNKDDGLKVHRASRLLAHETYSDSLKSVCNSYFGKYTNDFNYIANNSYFEKNDEMGLLSPENLTMPSRIMRINAYPNMPVPFVDNKIKCIIIEGYHSGTINTANKEYTEFFKGLKRNNIKTFIFGNPGTDFYESTSDFNDFGITVLPNIAPIAAYVKLWLLPCFDSNSEKILKKSLGGDIF